MNIRALLYVRLLTAHRLTAHRFLVNFLVILAAFTFSTTSSADTDNTNQLAIATKAKSAFKQKDYQQALTLYRQLSDIDNGYTVQYNLGVCHYKLKQWQQAQQTFSDLHNTYPEDEIVEYNLALSELKLGNTRSAVQHFDSLYLTAESDELAIMAMEHSLKLEKKPKTASYSSATRTNSKRSNSKHSDSKQWYLSSTIGLGTDDNVVSIVNDTPSTDSDTFTEFSLTPVLYSSSDLNNSWIIDGSYFQSSYADQSDYDISALGFGVRKNFSINNSNRVHAAARIDKSSVGGKAYMQSTHAQVGGRYKNQQGLKISYALKVKQSKERSAPYEAYAGNNVRLQLSAYQKIGKHNVGLEFRRENDDKNDRVGTTINREDTVIYSAARSTLTFNWRYTANKWNMSSFYSIRNSNYDDENIYFYDDAILPDRITREDKRRSYGIQAGLDISKAVFIELDLRNTSNDSNILDYSYDQRMLTSTLGVQF